MPRVPVATFRIIKHKLNGGNMQHEYDHNMRVDIPANAHEDLLHLNRVYMDKPEGRKISEFLDDELYKLKLETGNMTKYRKDSVGTVSLVLRASNVFLKEGKAPDWFDLEGWIKDSIDWADRTFNPPNHEIRFMNSENELEIKKIQTIYSAVLHLDESNPHIHVLLMPIDESGHLNARGTAANVHYVQLLTSYYEKVKKYGLERGEICSPAKAKNISRYHENLERAMSKEAPDLKPGESLDQYKDRVTDMLLVYESHMLEQQREHENELNKVKADKNRYVKQDYRLHREVNEIIGSKKGKDIDLERLRDIAGSGEKYKKMEKAIRLYPDRKYADAMQGDIRHLIQWLEEQERREYERNEQKKQEEAEKTTGALLS